MSLSLAKLQLESPFVQAALSGYSDWPMRVIARRMGASYTVCEVMLDHFVTSLSRRNRVERFLRTSDEEFPVGAQLMGANPDDFAPAARRLVQAGFDVIDINFGCPVKKVLGRCRGGFHLSQPETALEIIGRVRDAVPASMPVTMKMRGGIDGSGESREKFFRIFDGAFERGIAAATVHGRTVIQRYVGTSDWAFLREVKEHAGERIVIGSGDLFSPECCNDMLAYTGVDGVSVARGAIGNPWIFAQAQAIAAGLLAEPPSVHEQRDIIREHGRLSEEMYGSEKWSGQMRKFGIQYSELHPRHIEVRDAFIAARCPDEWHSVLQKWYSIDAPGRFPTVDVPNEHSSLAANC